ncbi:MAG: twitching motility protein PilT [Halobacteriaceae archaeon]
MDTSALMMPVEVGVRLFDELDRLLESYDPIVPFSVLDELDALSSSQGDVARAAAVGRDLAGRCTPVETEAGYADDALVELARTGEVDAVVTNDAPLKKRILDWNTPVIHLRGRNKLALTKPCTNESD